MATVPCMGYIELDLTFPAEFLGSSAGAHTLALVVPHASASQSFVLIGMNTLDILNEKYLKQKPVNYLFLYGYRAVLKVLEFRHILTNDNYHGIVQMHGKGPQTIPVGRTIVLD